MDEFYIEKKMYYHDTDCGGVVYYANYLKYLEEARTEFLLLRGIELPRLAESNTMFVVARVEIDYRAPARYQDKITISAAVEEAKVATIRFYQEIVREGMLLAVARTTLVCVGNDLKPRKMPQEVRDALKLR